MADEYSPVMERVFYIERLIELMRPRQTLWNNTSEDYFDKAKRDKCWMEVFCQMVPGFNDLPDADKIKRGAEIQKRWKVLRDCFRRELSKQKRSTEDEASGRRGGYRYFRHLSFLKDIIVQNRVSPTQNSEIESRKRKKLNTGIHLTEKPSSKEKHRVLDLSTKGNETPKESKKLKSNTDDDDMLFLLSLHGHFKAIPERKRILAKAEIIQVLVKYNDPPQFGPDMSHSNLNPPADSTLLTHYPPRPLDKYYQSNEPNRYSRCQASTNERVQRITIPEPEFIPLPSFDESSLLSDSEI